MRWVGLLLIGVYLYGAITYAKSIRYPSKIVTTEMLYRRLGEAGDGLSESYYAFSCPQVFSVVSQHIDKFVTADPTMAGGLQRLHFHDCFVRGCDGSVLLNSTAFSLAEKDAQPNAGSLRGFEQIDEIKAALEEVCPDTVSCADLLALVAREATVKAGGPSWSVPLGRRDGFESLESEASAHIPSPQSNFSTLVKTFAAAGFTAQEMVVLSGAHTIGRARCGAVQPRLYNFSGVEGLTDPSLDPILADELILQCPPNNVKNIIAMDSTQDTFDIVYFKQLLVNQGLFLSDAALITNPLALDYVTRLSESRSTFFADFAIAMEKLGTIQLLTGSAGEVRKRCAVVNSI
ncbi:peroxidase [Marchantia polymorpha subsp. ruderalis]|nr:hypothetical protein MARPO_0065s0079 [Marchantia polymorpha]BBM99677.1 hypothetical protein Mp_1g22970 [Marchantia polymorpha subsp. ruderalis]|eukprot:PTQ36280.1 hypothetical protein MARPO_0065s0079 [Marchantia polymorpha]